MSESRRRFIPGCVLFWIVLRDQPRQQAGPVSQHRPLCFLVCTTVAVAAVSFLFLGAVAGDVPDGNFVHGFNESDSEPPEFTNVSKINKTAIAANFSDNHEVDITSIERTDFRLSDGFISKVNTIESEPNATAILLLESPVNSKNVTVLLDRDAEINDTFDNELDPPEQNRQAIEENRTVVTGMDAVDPELFRYTVSNATGSPARVQLRATERLSGINVTIDGPETARLDRTNFEHVGGFRYVAEYRPQVTGSYTATLRSVTDQSGNARLSVTRRTFYADLESPQVSAGINSADSSGFTVAFEGAARDANGIDRYVWEFEDGITRTGREASRTFAPDTYTNYSVTLRVSDQYGNVGTDSLRFNLTEDNLEVVPESTGQSDEPAGTPNRPSGTVGDLINRYDGSATVSVPRTVRGLPVIVSGEEPLARRGMVSLESLWINTTQETGINLTAAAEPPGAVGDVTNNSRVPLGGFTILHDTPNRLIANATINFRVFTNVSGSEFDRVPDDIALYRFENQSWNRLQTTKLGTGGSDPIETATFRAQSPGLSRLAVVAKQEPSGPDRTPSGQVTTTETEQQTPSSTTPATPEPPATGVEVLNASVNRTVVPVNGTVSVNATVENQGDSLTVFTGGLSLNQTVVATQRTQIVPGESTTIQFIQQLPDEGETRVTVNDTVAGTVTVTQQGGGILSIFSFLPIGLFNAFITYVGGVITAAYLALKSAALYLDS